MPAVKWDELVNWLDCVWLFGDGIDSLLEMFYDAELF